MIQIGVSWEIGRTVFYVDDEDKSLVKKARIKEVHDLDNGDEISIQNAFTSKEEALGEPKNLRW